MSAGQWYVSRGRITRSTFWLYYVLPVFLLGLLASVIDVALGLGELELTTTAGSAGAWWSMGPVGLAVTLLTLVPVVSATVTRLHDGGRSAVWLLSLLIPVLGWLALLVVAGTTPGDPGPNQYGLPSSWAAGRRQPAV
jgi:uncharacterized membrane protein YhaH (DUF805 family)